MLAFQEPKTWMAHT